MKNREEIIGDCRLILGDCLEIIPSIRNIDAVITDPPYLLNETQGSMTGSQHAHKWNGMIKDKTAGIKQIKFVEWMPLIKETLSSSAHLFFFANDKQIFNIHNECLKNGYSLHNLLVWKKTNKTPNRWFMKNAEFIWFGWHGKAKWINKMSEFTCEEFNHDAVKLHPTQKPLKLLSKLVNSSQGETVLDPFMGSGTTGEACVRLNRKFVGIEIDREFFEISCKRIDNAYRNREINGQGILL